MSQEVSIQCLSSFNSHHSYSRYIQSHSAGCCMRSVEQIQKGVFSIPSICAIAYSCVQPRYQSVSNIDQVYCPHPQASRVFGSALVMWLWLRFQQMKLYGWQSLVPYGSPITCRNASSPCKESPTDLSTASSSIIPPATTAQEIAKHKTVDYHLLMRLLQHPARK